MRNINEPIQIDRAHDERGCFHHERGGKRCQTSVALDGTHRLCAREGGGRQGYRAVRRPPQETYYSILMFSTRSNKPHMLTWNSRKRQRAPRLLGTLNKCLSPCTHVLRTVKPAVYNVYTGRDEQTPASAGNYIKSGKRRFQLPILPTKSIIGGIRLTGPKLHPHDTISRCDLQP